MTEIVELLSWNAGVEAWGFETLVIGSALVGFTTTLVGTVGTSYHWLSTGVAAFVGGLLGSEVMAADWGPMVEGLTLVPALLGGIGLAVAVDFAVRRSIGGSYQPRGAQGGPRSKADWPSTK